MGVVNTTIRLAPLALLTHPFAPLGLGHDPSGGVESITAAEIAEHVTELASDAFEGRAAGSAGGRKAARYIAEAFASFGLAPIVGSAPSAPAASDPRAANASTADYFQPFQARGLSTQNVIGFLEGSHPERRYEYVVIGAHYDHLGMDAETGAIFNGADDDASGTSVMLELAEAFAHAETRPERSLVFIAFGAEEMGLLGSRHYVENPLRPLEQTRWMVNLEMMGRGDEGRVSIMMLASLPDSLLDAIGESALEQELEPVDGGSAHLRSGDQFPFHDAGVPILCFYGGENHPDYHQPTDTADKIQPRWMAALARTVYGAVEACANGEDGEPRAGDADD